MVRRVQEVVKTSADWVIERIRRNAEIGKVGASGLFGRQ